MTKLTYKSTLFSIMQSNKLWNQFDHFDFANDDNNNDHHLIRSTNSVDVYILDFWFGPLFIELLIILLVCLYHLMIKLLNLWSKYAYY